MQTPGAPDEPLQAPLTTDRSMRVALKVSSAEESPVRVLRKRRRVGRDFMVGVDRINGLEGMAICADIEKIEICRGGQKGVVGMVILAGLS